MVSLVNVACERLEEEDRVLDWEKEDRESFAVFEEEYQFKMRELRHFKECAKLRSQIRETERLLLELRDKLRETQEAEQAARAGSERALKKRRAMEEGSAETGGNVILVREPAPAVKKQKKRTCSVCRKEGHDSRTCKGAHV